MTITTFPGFLIGKIALCFGQAKTPPDTELTLWKVDPRTGEIDTSDGSCPPSPEEWKDLYHSMAINNWEKRVQIQQLTQEIQEAREKIRQLELQINTKPVDDATKPQGTRPPGPRYFPGRTPLNEITGGPIQPTDPPTALRSTTKQA